MKLDKIYLVTVRQLVKKEYIENGVHLERVSPKTIKNATVYLKNNKHIDVVTNETYNKEPNGIDGIYVDEKRPMTPFEEMSDDLKEEIREYGGKK